jgi:DNA repair exonuclease SbcCD ATPase subunit
MNYSKLSTEIIIKKINASTKEIRELVYELDGFQSDFSELYPNLSREQLEELCTSFANRSKELKARLKKKRDELAEIERQEEEAEREEKRKEKERKRLEIIEKSINDTSLLDRIKYRFFNLSIPDEEDPEGLNPASSPPFFNTKEEQFLHELKSTNFRLYTATYNGQDMSDQEEYKQKNLNKCFVANIEENYSDYLFVVFRLIKSDICGKCYYHSLWISNMKQNLNEIEDLNIFDFKEDTNIDWFALLFSKFGSETSTLIDEIYAR